MLSESKGDAQWSVANPEWGRNWIAINNLIPNVEYEVRITAKNEYGDTASSTLYRVKPRPKPGNIHGQVKISTITV